MSANGEQKKVFNGDTSKWIAIIVSILIATSSITFGVIQGSAKRTFSAYITKIERLEEALATLKFQQETERKDIEYIQRDISEIRVDIKSIKEILRTKQDIER